MMIHKEKQVFLKRFLTAIILAPAALLTILFAPDFIFSLIILLVMMLSLYEWGQFFKNRNQVWLNIFYYLTLAFFLLFYMLKTGLLSLGQIYYQVFFFSNVFLWMAIFFLLVLFSQNKIPKFSNGVTLFLGLDVLLCVFAASHQLYLASSSHLLFIYLLLLVWLADTSAYLFGTRYGRHKMAPHISPGKSWEGFCSALIMCSLFAIIWAAAFSHFKLSFILKWLLLSIVTVIFSVVGDLFISMQKRMSSLKDSGQLLPGHGGILDRIDSMLSAAPVFLIGLWLMGWNVYV